MEELKQNIKVLQTWVQEMEAILQNPYANGLNIEKIITDLKGYASNLAQLADQADQPAKAEAPQKAK